MTSAPDPQEVKSPPEPEPRYRYATVLPSALKMDVKALRELLPADAWQTGAYPETIDLPCSEVLASPTPRIRSSTLRSLIPSNIADSANLPEWLDLPQSAVALAYKTGSKRELLPPEQPKPEPKPEATETPGTPDPDLPKSPSGWKRFLKPIISKPKAPTDEAPDASGLPTGAESAPESNVEAAPAEANKDLPPPKPVIVIPIQDRPLKNLRTFQRLLLTDEELTLKTLPDLIAKLPGLQACHLEVHGVALSSTSAPKTIAAFATEANTALTALRKVAASTGKSLDRCLTIYDSAGPISFLNDGDASLLVVHDERNFIPGVRENLTALLAAIAAQE